MIEYKIVGVEGRTQFEHEVNRRIRQGWEPFGGASIDGAFFIQAMTRSTVENRQEPE